MTRRTCDVCACRLPSLLHHTREEALVFIIISWPLVYGRLGSLTSVCNPAAEKSHHYHESVVSTHWICKKLQCFSRCGLQPQCGQWEILPSPFKVSVLEISPRAGTRHSLRGHGPSRAMWAGDRSPKVKQGKKYLNRLSPDT